MYDGSFCDEEFHGIGLMTSKDKTEYEGEWHRGRKFGYGHMRHGVEKVLETNTVLDAFIIWLRE